MSNQTPKCPVCGNPSSKLIQYDPAEEWRECNECHHGWVWARDEQEEKVV